MVRPREEKPGTSLVTRSRVTLTPSPPTISPAARAPSARPGSPRSTLTRRRATRQQLGALMSFGLRDERGREREEKDLHCPPLRRLRQVFFHPETLSPCGICGRCFFSNGSSSPSSSGNGCAHAVSRMPSLRSTSHLLPMSFSSSGTAARPSVVPSITAWRRSPTTDTSSSAASDPL